MKMHKVEFCCCGCSLRDGTSILLWINAIWYAICMLLSVSHFILFLVYGVLLAIAISGLYGVFEEKPEFIIAHMVWQWIGIAFNVIIMVALLIAGTAIITQIAKISDLPASQKANFTSEGFGFIFLLELIIGSCAGLQYYFFVVVFSLYRKMKEEGSRGLNAVF